ncbi:MAG TPA: TIM barrel protein [Puia sp.]|nr:TIM barrel protein [Puia sp.]
MQIKILCPVWGHEHLAIEDFAARVKEAGFDGLDTWVPEAQEERRRLHRVIGELGMVWVSHQWQAAGNTPRAFGESFRRWLERCAEGDPLLINSHTGKDYFPFEQNLALLDIAAEFEKERGIAVAHETHRGRIGYHPASMIDYFNARDFAITADLSHWTCTTESFLENFSEAVDEAIRRTVHFHARVGFEEGPQVPDPRADEWQPALQHFLGWWDRMVEARRAAGAPVLTITAEFGPPPYLPTIPYSKQPVADQFTLNCYMKDLLRARYAGVDGTS